MPLFGGGMEIDMKKLISFFLAALFCLSLISCKKQPDDSKPDPAPSEPVTDSQMPENPEDSKTPDVPGNQNPSSEPAPETPDEPQTPENPSEPDQPSVSLSGWPTSGVAKRIPAPTKGSIEKTIDERTFFRADISGTDMEYGKEYANACRAEGFTKDISEDLIEGSTYMFSAENEKGYKVFVSYTGILIITISAP